MEIKMEIRFAIKNELDADEIKFHMKEMAEKGYSFNQAMQKCIGSSTWNKMQQWEKDSFLTAFYSANGVDIQQ